MEWMAKLVTAAQALLLAQFGAAKPSDAAMAPDLAEAAKWAAAVSAGTPDALQQYISQFPHGERLSDAFDLIVQNEIESAKSSLSAGALTGVQLSEARKEQPELLERNFDLGTNKNTGTPNQGGESLTPY